MDEVNEILTEKQERFCVNITQNRELFGNATLSYAEAYGFDIDAEPDDDAQYKFTDGSIFSEKELEDLSKEESKTYNTGDGKKIQDSSRKRMYDNCSTYGSKLKKNLKIQARCRELLNEFMVDQVIDARLTEIILDGDNNESISAIKEYNKLKQRIVEKKDLTSGGKPITLIFDSTFKEAKSGTTRTTEESSNQSS